MRASEQPPAPLLKDEELLLEMIPAWQRFFLALAMMGALGVGLFPLTHFLLGRAQGAIDLLATAVAGMLLLAASVAAGRQTRSYLSIRGGDEPRLVEVVALPWRVIVREHGSLAKVEVVELAEAAESTGRVRLLRVRSKGKTEPTVLTPWVEEGGSGSSELETSGKRLADRLGLSLERTPITRPRPEPVEEILRAAFFLVPLCAVALLVSRVVAALFA